LGPYFFDRNVTGIVYLRMLNEFVFPQLVVHFGNQYWEGHFRNPFWMMKNNNILNVPMANEANSALWSFSLDMVCRKLAKCHILSYDFMLRRYIRDEVFRNFAYEYSTVRLSDSTRWCHWMVLCTSFHKQIKISLDWLSIQLMRWLY
jgi:hypothetical protein